MYDAPDFVINREAFIQNGSGTILSSKKCEMRRIHLNCSVVNNQDPFTGQLVRHYDDSVIKDLGDLMAALGGVDGIVSFDLGEAVIQQFEQVRLDVTGTGGSLSDAIIEYAYAVNGNN